MGARRVLVPLLCALTTTVLVAVPASAAPPGPRVDLRVLVVQDGSPEVDAVLEALTEGGVPTDVVDLSDPARRPVDRASLTVPDAVPHARYQGVVLPGDAPVELAPAELTVLHDVEREFRLRQLNATVRATARTGLAEPSPGAGWSGRLDGGVARLTDAARADGFGDMRGDVPVGEDTWVEIGTPLAGYTTLLTGSSPDGTHRGPLLGVLRTGGREELGLSFSYAPGSMPFAALAPGLVEWLTRGVHLGMRRAWFAVHVDDVLLPDARWVAGAHCAYGADCPPTVPPAPTIRMTPADVDAAASWSHDHDFRLDLAFNGAGSRLAAPGGDDPLLAALLARRGAFGWINHTWSHQYLGCVRDHGVVPWRCATVPLLGWTRYVPERVIDDEVARNTAFARDVGLPINPSELVTGEHSGLRGDEEMPEDNPGLAGALDDEGIRSVAADASKEAGQRPIGGARTVPRHPIDLDFDTATFAETVDQYNWSHTSRADGGDGTCEADGGCVPPVPAGDPRAGFLGRIVPMEVTKALGHALANDPRPHYVHQPQLTEDRTLYPVLDQVLGSYRALYTEARPLLVPTMTQSAEVLGRQAAWATAAGSTRAWLQDGIVTVVSGGASDRPVDVPVTVPPALDGAFGEPYGTTRSGWVPVAGEQRIGGVAP
ncbi:hypothetical protein [Actinomycetospora succinea]|uniref:hypothetical protein n=1 Tax=Actinomycetospora succinea TaxID=663603 RepID=UPI00105DC259|nr:hypothetical protein [Actinomycetospora succinea]